MTKTQTQAITDESPGKPSLLIRIGNFFFRFRNAVFPLVLVPLAVIFKPVYPLGSEIGDRWLDVLGILIAFSGEGLRGLVIGYVYVKRGGRNKRVYADSLVTTGFFNHSRNPLYLGNLLVVLGLVIIHNSLWLYGLVLPFFLFAYLTIVLTEEQYLRQKFGKVFENYCRRVNRWWVDPRGLSQSLAGMTFNWRRVVVKEYGTIATFAGSILLLLVYETLAHHPYNQRAIYLNILFALLGLLVIGWALARYLKKTRRLTDVPLQARTN